MRKIKYLMNGFQFQYLIFQHWLEKYLDIDLRYPEIQKHLRGYVYIPKNFFLMWNMYRNWEIKNYDIVHFNNTENFLLFQPTDNQISIAESHGFDFWVNYSRYLRDEKNMLLKIIWWTVDKMIGYFIRKKIRQFDLYYCSTPDMLDPLRKIRSDVIWLPNPVNTTIFKPEWEVIRLIWNPACFFPTRLHWDKKPEYAIRIFQDYIKKNFPEATLHLLNQWFEVEKYKNELSDPETYFWHDFMDKETLAAKIRGSDLCFWDFSIGGLSLMPMQIMACRKPIVTYDMYELIKVNHEDLFNLTKQIFEDPVFTKEYTDRNYRYIQEVHSEEAICRMHLENLRPFIEKKLHIKF